MSDRFKEYTRIKLESDGAVGKIVMSREGGMNAFDTTMYGEIRHAVRALDDDDSVSVIMFASAGKAFAVGGDLKEMLSHLHQRTPSDQDIFRFQDNLPFDAIRFCRKPTIAAVSGLCVGGGLGLAVSCDFAIAAENSRFGAPEAKSGLIDGLLPSMLYDAVPLQKLKHMLFTGKLFDAAEALSMGLILEITPAEDVLNRAEELARDLQQVSLEAICAYKQIFSSYARRANLDEALRLIRHSAEAHRRLHEFDARSRQR